MPLSAVLNNQFHWASYTTQNGTVELRAANLPLISGNSYRLSFMVRSTVAQNIQIEVQDSALGNESLDVTRNVPADTWKQISEEFTAAATDNASVLRVHLAMDNLHNFFIDKTKLIDLTVEQKEYRIMRIRGSMRPGSFIQTLTLREKTAAETA